MQDENPFAIETPRGRGPYRNNRRQLVVDTAIRLFSWHGYDAASYKMLSKESGVSESAIHKLFGGKENLARICAAQVFEGFTADIEALAKSNLSSYDEHTKQACEVFKRWRDEIRFLVNISVTPRNAHIAQGNWGKSFWEKTEMFRPYEDEFEPEDYHDILYIMAALHLSYVVGGNEEQYESARKKLMQRFLKRE